MGFELGQTAVIVEIPEALPAVGRWRARFDTSAAVGVPPHVTVVFPFLALTAITAADRAELARLVAAEPRFTTTFGSLGEFPGLDAAPPVLYLEPSPADPYRRLTAAMWSSWPECPPYGGVYDEHVPHLTITETAPPEQIAAARRALAPALPVRAHIGQATLIDFDGARWRRNAVFPLG
jgi:2'-5' RNA ligase